MSRRPVFLERRGYRRRRVMDAARILPVLGAFLFLMPLFWALEPGRVMHTAPAGVYLFAVWLAMIAVAFVFARLLSRPEEGGSATGTGEGPGEGDGSGR